MNAFPPAHRRFIAWRRKPFTPQSACGHRLEAMHVDRSRLVFQLDELEAELPELLREHGRDRVMDAFAPRADAILEAVQTDTDDHRYALHRIDAMLTANGLGDAYLPPVGA